MTEFGGKALSVKKLMSEMELSGLILPKNVFNCKNKKPLNSRRAFFGKYDYFSSKVVIEISSV